MSANTKTSSYKKSAIDIKSTSLNAPLLVIFNTDLKQIKLQLEKKITQATDLFNNSPVIIDLQNCNQKKKLDISALIQLLQENKMYPIGISGGLESQNNQALKLNVPTHRIRETHPDNSETLPPPACKTPDDSPTEEPDAISSNPSAELEFQAVENMFISQPIRSGQRIYAKGDLTILSHVSAGSEIMAEGNIHVYGSLRGRALAGVQGDTESRIFCSELKAELVSIAGHYKISEELDQTKRENPVQVFLHNQSLIIKNL